jgi:hypothetical protein
LREHWTPNRTATPMPRKATVEGSGTGKGSLYRKLSRARTSIGIVRVGWVVVGSQRCIRSRNPHPRNLFIAIEQHPEKRETPVRSGPYRHKAAKQRIACSIEILNLGSVREVDVSEDGTETLDRGRDRSIAAGREKQYVDDVTADRGKQAQRAESAKRGVVCIIADKVYQALWGCLCKPFPTVDLQG